MPAALPVTYVCADPTDRPAKCNFSACLCAHILQKPRSLFPDAPHRYFSFSSPESVYKNKRARGQRKKVIKNEINASTSTFSLLPQTREGGRVGWAREALFLQHID